MKLFRAEVINELHEAGLRGGALVEATNIIVELAERLEQRNAQRDFEKSREMLAEIRLRSAMKEAKGREGGAELVEDRAGETEVAADELG